MRGIAIICSFLVLFPFNALADEEQADIAIIKRAGIPTPFSGVLYSDKAYAEQKARQEQTAVRAEERLKLELGLQHARLTLATSTTAAALAAEKFKRVEITRIKNERIVQLEKELIEAEDKGTSTLDRVLWVSLGAAAVIAGGVSIAAAAGVFRPEQ